MSHANGRKEMPGPSCASLRHKPKSILLFEALNEDIDRLQIRTESEPEPQFDGLDDGRDQDMPLSGRQPV